MNGELREYPEDEPMHEAKEIINRVHDVFRMWFFNRMISERMS